MCCLLEQEGPLIYPNSPTLLTTLDKADLRIKLGNIGLNKKQKQVHADEFGNN